MAQVFARFNFDNTVGRVTNSGEMAIDPVSVALLDRERNAGLPYTRTVFSRLLLETTPGYLRITPLVHYAGAEEASL